MVQSTNGAKKKRRRFGLAAHLNAFKQLFLGDELALT